MTLPPQIQQAVVAIVEGRNGANRQELDMGIFKRHSNHFVEVNNMVLADSAKSVASLILKSCVIVT
jgi:hypothetical protein